MKLGARYYDPNVGRFISQDSYLGESGTPPSLHRYLYAYGNPTVFIDLYGYSSWIYTAKEIDEYGFQLYQEGHKVASLGVSFLGAAYQVGTGFFSLGQFDNANQAYTDNDTIQGAAKQFGKGVVDSAKEATEDYVKEGVAVGTAKLTAKVGCGRWKQACGTAVSVVDKFVDKFGKVDPKITKESPSGKASVTQQSLETLGVDEKGNVYGGGVPKDSPLYEEVKERLQKKNNTDIELEGEFSYEKYPNPDPPMDASPVRYKPKTREELMRMRAGKRPTSQSTHGDQNIEYHHRQQSSVEYENGVIDEITEKVHRRDGNHTRHNKPSTIDDRQRQREINRHIKEVGPIEGAKYFIDGEGI